MKVLPLINIQNILKLRNEIDKILYFRQDGSLGQHPYLEFGQHAYLEWKKLNQKYCNLLYKHKNKNYYGNSKWMERLNPIERLYFYNDLLKFKIELDENNLKGKKHENNP